MVVLLDQKDILSLGVHDTCLFKVSVEAYRLGILLLGQQPNGDTNDFRAVMTPAFIHFCFCFSFTFRGNRRDYVQSVVY